MTSAEFSESLAFERLEPDPAEATMRLLALLVTWYANVHRDTDRQPQPYSVDDFLPNPYIRPRAEREKRFAEAMGQYAIGREERMAARKKAH